MILLFRWKAKKACNRETVAGQREIEEREGFVISAAESTSKERLTEQYWESFSSDSPTENSFLMDEISENIFNEEHNKLFLGKIQIREDKTWLSFWWRSRIWSEEIQNTNYSSHSARWAREYICVADWRWRNIFIKSAMQEVAEKLKNWEYAAMRKEITEKTKMGRISYATWSGITNSESVLLRSWLTEQLWHTYVPHQALITPSSKKPSREVGMPRNTREKKSISGNVFDCQHARREPDEFHNDSRKLAVSFAFLRKEGIENSGSEKTIAINTFTLLFSKSEEKTSRRQISLMSMTNDALSIWTCTQVVWQFRVISTRICICNSLTRRNSELDREFPSRSLRKSSQQKGMGEKILTPSGRKNNVFSWKQLGLVHGETHVVFYTRVPRETPWGERGMKWRYARNSHLEASILFGTESERRRLTEKTWAV